MIDETLKEQEQEQDQDQEQIHSINLMPKIILSRNNSRSKMENVSRILLNMEEGKNMNISTPSDDSSNYYNYDSEDENLLHIFDNIKINPKTNDVPHYTYKKIDFKDVEYKINKSYAEINNKYSSALDVLASYLKGQSHIHGIKILLRNLFKYLHDAGNPIFYGCNSFVAIFKNLRLGCDVYSWVKWVNRIFVGHSKLFEIRCSIRSP